MTTYRHILVTGQSNAAGGATGNPTLDAVVSPSTQSNRDALVADAWGYLEPITNPTDDGVEYQFIQRTIVERAQPAFGIPTIISTHAAGGTAYTGLKKGTVTYAAAIATVTATKAKLDMFPGDDTYEVVAVHVDHGEANAGTAPDTYAGYLDEWITDYRADIVAVTGQTHQPLMFMAAVGSVGDGTSCLGVLRAHRTEPYFIAVGPKYQLPYGTSTHQTALGHYLNGEYHAKALAYTIETGRRWEPLSPLSITRNANIITIVFSVPVGALQFKGLTDGTGSTTGNKGFAYSDSTSSATISSVAITAEDTVTITLNTTPTGTSQTVSYGNAGVLCDSDDYPSAYDGRQLHNWCMPFSETVGFTYTPLALPSDAAYSDPAVEASGDIEEWDETWWTRNLEMWDGTQWVTVQASEVV